jgi:hypothetical protein
MLRVPVQISTNQVPVPHLGILYSRQLIFINAGHENEDIFKNVFTKKGVEYFYLSNDTNKGIAIFREAIPLRLLKTALFSLLFRSQEPAHIVPLVNTGTVDQRVASTSSEVNF